MHALWIPIFSMRSYETGKYAILKDGNFQLTLARILASDFDEITIALPLKEDISDFVEFYDHQDRYFTLNKIVSGHRPQINFVHLQYGANAVETRRTFWKNNRDFFYSEAILDFDLLITDITGYPGTMSFDIPFINNFNITKLPELDRPYIDEFFDEDLRSIEASLFSTVINPRQAEYIIQVRPDLKDKIKAYTKVAHDAMLPKMYSIQRFDPFAQPASANRDIFWPFRISDKAYKFEECMDAIVKTGLHRRYKITITDPNDTFKGELADKYKFIKKVKLSKVQYYEMLNTQPVVIMLDEIDTVLHPGTIEFFHYNCKVITLLSELLPHENMVETVDQVPQKLRSLVYNAEGTDISAFEYKYGEVSNLYNKNNIESCVKLDF
jgi:hypothetical protein